MMLALILVALLVWAALAIIGFAVKVALLALVGVILFSITGVALLLNTVL
jgi:hypothetical protein